MTVFTFSDEQALGHVISVDTANVVIDVDDVEKLRMMQVNRNRWLYPI